MTLARPDGPPARTRPRGAKILLILGVVLLVAGVLAGRSGVGRVERRVNDIRNNGDDVRNALLLELTVPGDETVDLEPGRYDVFALYSLGSTGFRPRNTTTSGPVVTDGSGTTPDDDEVGGFDEPDVTITDPDGRPVFLGEPSIESMFAGAAGELYAVHSFRITVGGTYRVAASGGEADKVGVGPTLDDGAVGRLVTDGAITLVGFLVAGLGSILALAGGIWFLVGGKPPPAPGPWAPLPGRPLAPTWGGPPPGPWTGPPMGHQGPTAGWAPPPPPGTATRPPPPVPTAEEPPAGPVGPLGPRPPQPSERPWGSSPPERDGPTPWSPPTWTPPTWTPPATDTGDDRT